MFILVRLTFTRAALSYQTNHQRCALIAFCRCIKRFHYKLMGLRLGNKQIQMLAASNILPSLLVQADLMKKCMWGLNLVVAKIRILHIIPELKMYLALVIHSLKSSNSVDCYQLISVGTVLWKKIFRLAPCPST